MAESTEGTGSWRRRCIRLPAVAAAGTTSLFDPVVVAAVDTFLYQDAALLGGHT